MIFVTAPARTVTMPIHGKPCALMKPFIPVAIITSGVPIR